MIGIMTPEPFDRLPESAFRRFRLAARERLFAQGTRAEAVVLVDVGELLLLRVTEAGHGIVIGRGGPGEVLAEASLSADAYHCDCIAAVPSQGRLIDAGAVRDALVGDPEFALRHVARLAGQLRDERLRVEIMSIRSAEDRILAALSAFGQAGSLTAFAQRYGLTQEACSRAMRRLVDDGRVRKLARGRYRVARTEPQALR